MDRTVLPRHPGVASWRRTSVNAVTALVVALLFPLALAAMPGELFLRVKRLQLYEDVDVGAVVALERRFWPGYPIEAQWSATVTRVRTDKDGEFVGRVVCAGSGRDALGGTAHERIHLVVQDWLHDPECDVDTGENYIITATWRFPILGLTKTVVVQTPSEPLPALPRSLTPSLHSMAP
jgi:hypothetical protein